MAMAESQTRRPEATIHGTFMIHLFSFADDAYAASADLF
jgi:hypothetical protein